MTRKPERTQQAVAALQRMAAILETGVWPSGARLTTDERRVIVANAERMLAEVHDVPRVRR